MVGVDDKKEFIQWFLGNYQLKKCESVWILNYIINHEDILNKVHFVSEARFCPRGVIMSTHCTKEIPFRFYKKFVVTTDADKAFHDIRLNKNEDLYIQLNFNNSNSHYQYVNVLEENPHEDSDTRWAEYSNEADKIINRSLFENKKNNLKTLIDQALDNDDEDDFYKLSKELKILEENQMSLT